MKLPSTDEMRGFDRLTIESGISELDLIEQVGKALFERLTIICKESLKNEKPILLLIGPGNNGADGLVLARHLILNGYPIKIVLSDSDKYSEGFSDKLAKLCNAAKQCGIGETLPVFTFSDIQVNGISYHGELTKEQLKEEINSSALVIDALLGIGVRGEPRGSIGIILDCLHSVCQEIYTSTDTKKSLQIVSIDVPSGIDSDTGEVFRSTVRADVTLTIELIKLGMMLFPAREFCGEIDIVQVGIDTTGDTQFNLSTKNNLPCLPLRPINSHKNNFGRVLVVGGSESMPGAPVLSAHAALRAGAGVVFLAVPGQLSTISVFPEIMYVKQPKPSPYFSESALESILPHLTNPTLIGPGLGNEPCTYKFISALLAELSQREYCVVVDADALNCMAANNVRYPNIDWVYTPHPGEAKRLNSNGRFELFTDLKGVVVLKGAGTIIYSQGKGYINSTGNPYLATAGSGDVLAGMIAAYVAQGLNSFDAARLAVYNHGTIADRLSHPLIATDLINALPGI